ncbi:MAG: hypothetical protein Pars92KO_27040 [Parasphingorhabdus sp.]
MKTLRVKIVAPAIATMMLLSACGESGGSDAASEASSEAATVQLPNGMTIQQQIEARQGQLEKVGDAFKAISDQLKASSPDIAVIQEAAAAVPEATEGMADWWPESSGPESGVETDALPAIWENMTDFQEKVGNMQEAAATLNTTAQGGDMAAIGEAFKATGGTCKACHDDYRLDD